MSSSATEATSTTASSTSSASNRSSATFVPAPPPAAPLPVAPLPAARRPDGCGNGPPITGPLPQPSPGNLGVEPGNLGVEPGNPGVEPGGLGVEPGGLGVKAGGLGVKVPRDSGVEVEVVACGALAGHIREIAARRGWPVQVRPIAAALHNRPQQIKGHAERMLATPETPGSRAVLAYADCGTYGALDKLTAQAGVSRLPGLHCYDLYAGAEAIEQLFAEEPGTYLLTDYLIRSFDKSVIQPLGLDRHPELWSDYFGHYRRLVWLVQESTSELEESATRVAERFSLPLSRIETGTRGLEAALALLIDPRS